MTVVSAGLQDYGAPSLTGAGWVFKFAFERQGAHTLQTLIDELNGIVLNGGTIDTKSSKIWNFQTGCIIMADKDLDKKPEQLYANESDLKSQVIADMLPNRVFREIKEFKVEVKDLILLKIENC